MLIYVGTHLHSHSFEDNSSLVRGNKGQYSMAIDITDEYDLSELEGIKNDRKLYQILLYGNAELKGYAFNGEKPDNLIDKEHLAFRVSAEFKVIFEVALEVNVSIDDALDDPQCRPFLTALAKVGVIEKLQQLLDASSFKKVDVRRVPVECKLVPLMCDAE